MNISRRQLLSTLLSAPAVAAIPGFPTEKTGRTLSTHQKAVMNLCQDNMRKWYKDYVRMDLDLDYGHPIELPTALTALIDDTFPRQFSQLRILDLAGTHAALAPCNLLYVENETREKDCPFRFESLTDASRRYKEDFHWHLRYTKANLDLPNFDNPHLKKVTYISQSLVIPGPAQYANSMDTFVLKTMFHTALQGSWRAVEFFKGPYVLCHPTDAYVVQRRSGLTPTLFEFISPGTAYIGFKQSEYHASFYFMPYVPMQINEFRVNDMNIRSVNPLRFDLNRHTKVVTKSRFGLVDGGNPWNNPWTKTSGMVKVKV